MRPIHNLKADRTHFQALMDGDKTFDVRKADRDYRIGDIVRLCETKYDIEEMRNGAPLLYTGRNLQLVIQYIQGGGRYGVNEGYVVLALGRA